MITAIEKRGDYEFISYKDEYVLYSWYDPKHFRLELKYHSGNSYYWLNVYPEVYEAFKNTEIRTIETNGHACIERKNANSRVSLLHHDKCALQMSLVSYPGFFV